MTIDERQVPQGLPEDLSDLLSEVRHADVLANDPCTREFLQAGERLLHDFSSATPRIGPAAREFPSTSCWPAYRGVKWSTRQRGHGPGRAGRRAS